MSLGFDVSETMRSSRWLMQKIAERYGMSTSGSMPTNTYDYEKKPDATPEKVFEIVQFWENNPKATLKQASEACGYNATTCHYIKYRKRRFAGMPSDLEGIRLHFARKAKETASKRGFQRNIHRTQADKVAKGFKFVKA